MPKIITQNNEFFAFCDYIICVIKKEEYEKTVFGKDGNLRGVASIRKRRFLNNITLILCH